jgi:hypothetical protein
MRWKISHRGHPRHDPRHDPRQIDLMAALALVIVIVAALQLFGGAPVTPNSTATFIVPSQSVRW